MSRALPRVMRIAILSVVSILLLVISSCNKRVIQNKGKVKDKVKSPSSRREMSISKNKDGVGENDLFSPISEDQAKQFVSAIQQNINIFNEKDFSGSINASAIRGVISDKVTSDSKKSDRKVSVVEHVGACEQVENQGVDVLAIRNLSKEAFCELVRQIEAKLYDIPIPMNSQALQDCFCYKKLQNNIMLGYANSMDMDEIVLFYTQEMERLGWDTLYLFDGHSSGSISGASDCVDGCSDGTEVLIAYKKPMKFCSISIRSGCDKGRDSYESQRSFGFSSNTQERAKIVICTQM